MRRLLLGLLPWLALGCGEQLPGKPDPSRREKRPEEVRDFHTLYEKNCSGCHGKDGRYGPAAPLNDVLLMAILPEEQVRKVLREGRAGTPMPRFAHTNGGTLTDEQVEILVKGLKRQWGSSRVKTEGVPAYLAGAVGDPTQGAKVYSRACAGCHGDQGQGGQEAGAINDSALLGLMTDQALRRLIITGRADLGMPDYSERKGRSADFKPLTDREVTDLTAFVANWRESTGDKK